MKIVNKAAEKQRVDQVNGLLKKVFGERAKGNLQNYKRFPLPEQDDLEMIATGVGIPFFYKIIGKFTKKNGSELRVLPKYTDQAKTYASLYEEVFGSEVTIIIDPKAVHYWAI